MIGWRTRCSALLLSMGLGAGQAHAGQADPAIVVTGTRLNPDQARARAVDFVRRTGVAGGQQQVARWIDPVCPKVVGLSDRQAKMVEGKLLGIANAARIRIAQRPCVSNIVVTFTADAPALMRSIAGRKSSQFSEVPVARRDALRHGAAPVRWWYATQMRDGDGGSETNLTSPAVGTDEGGLPVGLPMSENSTATQQYGGGSLIKTATVRALYGATVIVDISRIGPVSLEALADHAAMVAFAEIDPETPPSDSILALFQPYSVERTITDWDLAFLRSLYRMPLDRRGRIQRGHLVEALLDGRMGRAASQAPVRR